MDALHLRASLSRFVTGVVVVSYRAEGEIRGLTVNSFTSVSLDPPLVLVSVARSARAAAHLGRVPFTVNVLGAEQLDAALHFAGRPRDGLQVTWQSTGDDLAPTLAGALATSRCRAWDSYDGGDHRLHLGLVVEADAVVRASRCCSTGVGSGTQGRAPSWLPRARGRPERARSGVAVLVHPHPPGDTLRHGADEHQGRPEGAQH